ncbi:hypothetical protein F1654_08240 [Alkalicaulis satelles]|uniref:Uncharacterized protein n=2 Tax=Alkalicaulis satelles TaxID=2609175 RepID=A0A5M6ZKN2_9PROT|nr:hypothetical protein F1654_08240 [Alkalicaulis satelles]
MFEHQKPSSAAAVVAERMRKVAKVERVRHDPHLGIIYRVTFEDGKVALVRKYRGRYQSIDAKFASLPVKKLSGRPSINPYQARGRGKLIYERNFRK